MQLFVPHLSHHTAPLYPMLQKNATFDWTPSANMTFQNVKSILVKARENSLKHLNLNLPIMVQADASSEGLVAVLLQKGQPIAFASKRLSYTEKCYTNIEQGLLASVFACKQFCTYLYGKTFIAENDHKPLEMITLKNLVAACPWLQRMLLCLQQYDVIVWYHPGRDMLLVDALSHQPSPSNTTTLKLDVTIDHHGFTISRLQQLKAEISQDPVLSISY